jgi:hypothetical protein
MAAPASVAPTFRSLRKRHRIGAENALVLSGLAKFRFDGLNHGVYELLADKRCAYTLCNGNFRIRAFFLIIQLVGCATPHRCLGARLGQRLPR